MVRAVSLTSCRRVAATICPCSSPPPVGAEAPCAAEQTATQEFPMANTFPRLPLQPPDAQTRGEQSGLVTYLDLWPWKWCESRVTWATSVPISVFLGLSVLDLGQMNATDVRQTDGWQHHSALLLQNAVIQFQNIAFPFQNDVIRLDALALSVIATATWLAGWLGGWLGGCLSQPVMYQND